MYRKYCLPFNKCAIRISYLLPNTKQIAIELSILSSLKMFNCTLIRITTLLATIVLFVFFLIVHKFDGYGYLKNGYLYIILLGMIGLRLTI